MKRARAVVKAFGGHEMVVLESVAGFGDTETVTLIVKDTPHRRACKATLQLAELRELIADFESQTFMDETPSKPEET